MPAMQTATLMDDGEPLPLPPPPRAPRLARGSIAPPLLDADILGIRILEHAAPGAWGPIERVTLRDHVDRIALSVVCGLGTVAAMLAVALLA
ncbi:MAG TPA: hypothetical protein VM261_10830 [Kofleriaceae bacterium]|nr:hypothetical protein [Kofleriaceae bacterium]